VEYFQLLLLVLILLLPALKCGLVVDDVNMVNSVRGAKISGLFKINSFKKLREFFRVATYGAGITNNSWQDHAINLTLHCINSLLVLKFTGSMLIAFLWAVNPINNQLSIWLNGRRYAVALMFVLLALSFKSLLAPALFMAATFHVSAVPAMIFLLQMPYIFMLPAAGYAFYLFGWKSIKYNFQYRLSAFTAGNELQKIKWQKVIVVIKGIGYNFFHSLLPIPRMYHNHLYYFGRYKWANENGYALNLDFWKGVAVTAFLVYEMAVGNWWAGWFLLFILPWCGICNVTMNAADRYNSLPAIGVMAILAKYILMVPSPYKEIVLAIITTLYVIRYQRLFLAYQNIEEFYRYHVEVLPKDVEARYLWASNVIARDPYKAFTILKEGLKYNPEDFKLLLGMTQAMLQLGLYKQALQVLTVAEQHIPLNEEDEAIEVFNQLKIGVQGLQKKQKVDAPLNRTQRRTKCRI